MPLPKLVWAAVGIAVVVVVLVGAVVGLGLASLGGDLGGGGGAPPTQTVTLFPAGFTHNYSGVSSQIMGHHILAGGTFSGNYTVSGPDLLFVYVLTAAQLGVFESTGSVASSLWSSQGASSVGLQYSVPSTGSYYFLVYHPNGPTASLTVTTRIQVTLVTVV